VLFVLDADAAEADAADFEGPEVFLI